MRLPALAVVFATILAGCSATVPVDVEVPEEPEPAISVLTGTVEPDELTPPVFGLLGAIAAGGPVYGAGEPSAWVDLSGTLYAAFPGCDRGFYLVPLPTPGAEDCGHGLVYRSADAGTSWERLNADGTGRYTPDGPTANGDADVAVDAAGNLYASNLGGGIQFHTRWAETDAWEYMANVVPDGEGADRQWMAAGKEGHVIMTWMRTSPARDVEVNVTFDGGRTWQHAGTYGDGIGWLGTVQIAPDGEHAYIPYTQPIVAGTAPIVSGPQECAMRVLASEDGGRNWTDIDTGARWTTSQTGGHWSCVHMAPALDVTGDGSVVVAWSMDINLATGPVPDAATLGQQTFAIISHDNATTWSAPTRISGMTEAAGAASAESAIMPWVTGGAGDRFAVTYLSTVAAADQDYAAAVWDVRAVVVDGLGTPELDMAHSLIEASVHAGGICTRGGACLLTGSDRAFLDFFEADLTPDGQLFVVYPHDLNPSKMIEIRTALQNGGSPLAIPA